MADREQLAILKQGVAVWNAWRLDGRRFIPDLFEPDLREAPLSEADLREFGLDGANLGGADLRNAELSGADLRGANLRGTDLTGAILAWANATGASFVGASLKSVSLIGTNLNRADQRNTDLSHCVMESTLLADLSLNDAIGLDTVSHRGPSTIGIDTIFRSEGDIPEAFLRGAGVPDQIIVYAKSLVASPIKYYSCFISYSSKDGEFAERLHKDLREHDVRCWFAPEDLTIGDKVRPKIDEAIRFYDKVLVVLSEESVKSPWVETEVESAFERERRQNRTVVFPIRLDDSVMEVECAWAAEIRRTRHIGDFRGWKKYKGYQSAFLRLMRDLNPERNLASNRRHAR